MHPGLYWIAVAQIAGYLTATLLAEMFVGNLVRLMGDLTPPEARDPYSKQFGWKPALFGCVERVLYVTAFQIGRPEWAAYWIGLKILARWKGSNRWTKSDVRAREMAFEVYLLGTAMSLLWGATGAAVATWLCMGHRGGLQAIGLTAAMLFGNAAAIAYLNWWRTRD